MYEYEKVVNFIIMDEEWLYCEIDVKASLFSELV